MPLAPILVRANVVHQLREIRKVIAELEAADDVDPSVNQSFIRQAKAQALRREHDKLKREFIFLISDNTCS